MLLVTMFLKCIILYLNNIIQKLNKKLFIIPIYNCFETRKFWSECYPPFIVIQSLVSHLIYTIFNNFFKQLMLFEFTDIFVFFLSYFNCLQRSFGYFIYLAFITVKCEINWEKSNDHFIKQLINSILVPHMYVM